MDHRKHWYILQYPHVTHDMKTISTLLNIVQKIHRSLVNSLHKVSVMQKFDDYFDMYLSKFWTNNGLAGEFRHLHLWDISGIIILIECATMIMKNDMKPISSQIQS